MDKIKPFKKLPIAKYFQRDYEKIQMAFRLASSIVSETGNIKSCGEEVEIAVRSFFKDKLYPRYHISQGHIIDSELNASSQFDIIISDNTKNPVFCIWSDNTEIVYYESVYAIGEIKKSFYKKDLLIDFSKNIQRIMQLLKRAEIPSDFIECSNITFSIGQPVTNYPLRNPLLTFMFFVDSTNLKLNELGLQIKETGNQYMPNYLVFQDWGIVLNLDSEEFKNGRIKINLYPEFAKEANEWKLLQWDNPGDILAYQYMMLVEHLNSSVVTIPDLKTYTKKMFDFSITNFHEL